MRPIAPPLAGSRITQMTINRILIRLMMKTPPSGTIIPMPSCVRESQVDRGMTMRTDDTLRDLHENGLLAEFERRQ